MVVMVGANDVGMMVTDDGDMPMMSAMVVLTSVSPQCHG